MTRLESDFARHFTAAFGAPVHHLGTVGSTMEEARSLSAAGAAAGTVVVADSQDSGRGRIAGRRWIAPPGEALLATLILGPERASLPGFTLRIGLALARACETMAIDAGSRLRVSVKWPNDLLVGERKLGGILCEAGPKELLVGFGINLAQPFFPGGLGSSATSLSMETKAADFLDLDWPGTRGRLLEFAVREITRALAEENWREALEQRLWARGREESLSVGRLGDSGKTRVLIVGLADSGALIVEDRGGTRSEVFAGEIEAR